MTVPVRLSSATTWDELLSVCKESYDRCIDTVTHAETISGISANTRMHCLKFDGNQQPMVEALAECLYEHVIAYCISARNRPSELTVQDAARLTKEARKLFIHPPATPDDPDQTGEAGEMLLYLLMEAVLRAPQVVAKMELKTSSSMEIHGSDGIHMAWSAADSIVDVFFGEAKVYKDVGAAMTAALNSVDAFHADDVLCHELKMATKYFKHAEEPVKAAVSELLRNGKPSSDVRVNHALLIGYDWAGFNGLTASSVKELTSEFKTRYRRDAPRLHGLMQSRFSKFNRKTLRFEIFFLPFSSVQGFRDAFNRALG
ncbi:MAG TPA: DUF1837 domain-containing protein [Polyangiaceae bacterium]